MSAKRARKPLSEVSSNKRRKTNQKENSHDPELRDPNLFIPMSYIQHSSEPRIPEQTELKPSSFFNLFWGDEILDHIVRATNSYALMKRAKKKQWRREITRNELRAFLGITIMMGVVRVPCKRKYWTLGLLAAARISSDRYHEIKRYLHISIPNDTINLPHHEWWKKLEPLNSHLRQRSRDLLLPSTNLSIDEMMVSFTGRSRHTVRIPSKPIPVGYKIFAICDNGYTIDWLLTSRTESVAQLTRIPELSPTSSAVIQLCRSLDTRRSYILYMDNGFSTIPLFRRLREMGIGACGTTRINSAEYPSHLKDETTLTEWNTVDGVVVGNPEVLCFRWLDNNVVRLLTTVHKWQELTLRERRKPCNTSTNASIARKAFGNKERKAFYIPSAIDDYNHFMGGVDLADQRRAYYTTHQRTRRNWLCILLALLDISVSNSFLFILARNCELNKLLDTGKLTAHDILQHPLARSYSAELFRRILYRDLNRKESETIILGSVKRSAYRRRQLPLSLRKTQWIYFTKNNNLNSVKTHNLIPATSNQAPESETHHQLYRLSKRRECAVCRYEFRKKTASQNPISTLQARRRPKLTQYECRSCRIPTALCGPVTSQCFQRWHEINTSV
jgi:hypothetical protein